MEFAAIPITVIVAAPILRSIGVSFGFVGNILTRIVLIGAIIFASKKDVFLGMLTALAVVTLVLERNHALMYSLPNQYPLIKGQENLYPVKAVENPFSHVNKTIEETDMPDENAKDLEDNIPDLNQAPTSDEAPGFFKEKGLL